MYISRYMVCCFFQEACFLGSAVDNEGPGPGPGAKHGPTLGSVGWGRVTLPINCALVANYSPTIRQLFAHYSPTIRPLFADYSPTIRPQFAYDLLTIFCCF